MPIGTPRQLRSFELRRRPLPSFRPRFSLLGLIIVVGVAALFLSVGIDAVRLQSLGSYHANETWKAANSRPPGPPYGPTPMQAWHPRQYTRYRAAGRNRENLLRWMTNTLITVLKAAAIHRWFPWKFVRPDAPPQA